MNLIDRFIGKRGRGDRGEGVFWVSDLTKPCMLCTDLGVVTPGAFDIERRRVFAVGGLVETFWVDALRGLPETWVFSTQVPAHFRKSSLEVHGRVDALVQHKRGPLVVHEVKSVKSLYFVEEPIVGHVEQMHFYLNVLGLEEGQLEHIDKQVLLTGRGDVVDRSFSIKRDPEVFLRLLERAEELSRFIDVKEMPPPTKCWLCRLLWTS